MTDLSRESRGVIEAGARALAPSAAARAKIRAAVAARVSGTPGTGGGEGAAGQGAGVAAAGGQAAKIWLSVLVLGGIAAAVLGMRWYLQGSRGERPVAASATGEAVVAPAPAPTVKALTTIGPPSVPPVAAPTRDRARLAPPGPDAARPPTPGRAERAGSTLELEVALLSEARGALADGAPARALATLARHGREIGAPQMAKEAALLRAEALCAEDRAGEGRAVLAEVDARWPGAAGAAAVRARCGAD